MINRETHYWGGTGLKGRILQTINIFFGYRNILYNILILMLTGVTILEGITPFILPFVAVVPLDQIPNMIIVVFLFGLFSQNTNILLLILSMFILWLIKKKTSDTTIYSMLALPLLIGFTYTPVLVASDFISFDIFLLGLQIIMGLTSAYIFKQGLSILQFEREKTVESIICAVIMWGLALSGITSLTVADISVLGTLSKLILLITAYISGIKLAATIGIIIGLLSNFSHPNITHHIAFYGFTGLTAGIMNNWKKPGVILGYIGGGLTIFLYSLEFFEFKMLVLESLAALSIFLITPKAVFNKIQELYNGEQREKIYQKKVKDAAIKKIYQFASIFRELAQGFNDVAISKYQMEQQSVHQMIETIQKKACGDCKKANICWQKEFLGTYKDLFKMVNLAEEGQLAISNIPDQLFKKCINTKGLVDITQSVYELHKTNYQWHQSLLESKGLVANQLEGIAKIMENLAMDINLDIGRRRDIEQELWQLLDNVGIECEEIYVKGIERDRPEVQIVKKSCGGNGECEKIVAGLIEKRFKNQMCVLKGDCGYYGYEKKLGNCKFALLSKEMYKMSIGLGQKGINGVCGDTFSQFSLDNGKQVLILSDGMGKGEKAKGESERIVGLLKKMLQVGFDTEKAIKAVNTILSLRNNEESFATLDIAVIDLYTGKTKFFKNGAAMSFIKSGKEVKRIEGNNLPVGMLENVGATVTEYPLQKDDFLIMVSDGVLDSNPVATDKEGWLTLLLENITPNISPNRLAELILHKSRQRGIESKLDDLTVVVIKLEGNSQPSVLGRWVIEKMTI
ncbi:stage II sporulation protein E [Anaerobranca californiensis DSM 14826]|uniref:Stage II sporulation protein E n=1 Tax=Anaerobranca californiensis DSM 14826 TaxID=1120989 RepID=A0A1M6PHI4_9FIRM|nr:stage II sporulation protein E [Anaerobranca californiensis]SHK07382.1 stage II sporulation protein E [Anaerobranca californiensis DSM 14826]